MSLAAPPQPDTWHAERQRGVNPRALRRTPPRHTPCTRCGRHPAVTNPPPWAPGACQPCLDHQGRPFSADDPEDAAHARDRQAAAERLAATDRAGWACNQPPAPNPFTGPGHVAFGALTCAAQELYDGGALSDGADPHWVADRLRAAADRLEREAEQWRSPRPPLGGPRPGSAQ